MLCKAKNINMCVSGFPTLPIHGFLSRGGGDKMSRLMTKPTKNMCAPIEGSDQPGHPPSLIRVFAVRSVGS